MLLSAVYVLVVAQLSSEIPEGLMNNPVLEFKQLRMKHADKYNVCCNVLYPLAERLT